MVCLSTQGVALGFHVGPLRGINQSAAGADLGYLGYLVLPRRGILVRPCEVFVFSPNGWDNSAQGTARGTVQRDDNKP